MAKFEIGDVVRHLEAEGLFKVVHVKPNLTFDRNSKQQVLTIEDDSGRMISCLDHWVTHHDKTSSGFLHTKPAASDDSELWDWKSGDLLEVQYKRIK